MTDSEVFPFQDVFRRLERMLAPKRFQEDERQRMSADYFKLLRKFTLAQVQAGAETWMGRSKYFPKPVEWIDAIPQRQVAPELAVMTVEQSHEHRRAAGLRYEDAPCLCRACHEADVHEKPLRFVPDCHPNGTICKMRDGERIVVAGHWAHGVELARYYLGKAEFYERFYAALAKREPSAPRQ